MKDLNHEGLLNSKICSTKPGSEVSIPTSLINKLHINDFLFTQRKLFLHTHSLYNSLKPTNRSSQISFKLSINSSSSSSSLNSRSNTLQSSTALSREIKSGKRVKGSRANKQLYRGYEGKERSSFTQIKKTDSELSLCRVFLIELARVKIWYLWI